MCRYFPAGTDILHTAVALEDKDVYVVAGTYQGKLTVAMVNVGEKDKSVQLTLPRPMENASLYKYEENLQPKDADGFPVPQETGFHLKGTYKTTLKARTFQLLTDIQ